VIGPDHDSCPSGQLPTSRLSGINPSSGNSFRAVVVFVGDRLQPDSFSLLGRGDGDVGKAALRCRAVPVLYTRGTLYDISLVDDLCWFASFLVITRALRDEQNLTSWMNMPIQLCTCVIGRYSNRRIECAVSDT